MENQNFSRDRLQRELNSLRRPGTLRKKRVSRLRLIIGSLLLILLIGAPFLVAAAGLGAFRSIIDTAPDIKGINVTPTGYATFVYDKNGTQTAKLVASDSNRIPVTLDLVPEDLQHAFVAVEDSRFYEHNGIDIEGILRAGILGLTSGEFSQGASTITQQLVKNSVFTGWTHETKAESIRRKIQEQYLAIQLEKTMDKDDILLNYMNTINLGHNTLGVQSAAQTYFGKSVSQLTLSEDAVIAGITQNPSAYDPIVFPENNKKRRKIVLDDMLEQGWINDDEYQEAMADDVYSRIREHSVTTQEDVTKINSYFVDALTDQLLADLQAIGYTETQAQTLLFSGGLNVYSTQDPDIQKICDEEANNEENYPAGTKWALSYELDTEKPDGSTAYYFQDDVLDWMKQTGAGSSILFTDQDAARSICEQYKASVLAGGEKETNEIISFTAEPQISLTLEDQRTGYVLAIVGGRGEKTANRTLNRATSTDRQPGSTFKVVSTYAPALDAGGKTLATTYEDAPYTYANGTPVRNWYGEAYRGTCTIRDGIRDSLNIIAVKTLTDITPELGYQYLLDFGFTTIVDREIINDQVFSDITQTMALGGLTHGVRNIELNAAYATIANGGEYIEPKFYTKVTDHDGNVILDTSVDRKTRQVLQPDTAWLLTSAMVDVVTKGTGTRCQISETQAAGKTGTTSDEHDVWFAGFTDYYTCTTWAGYDEEVNLSGLESGIAKILWKAVMERVHEGYAWKDFTQPAGITQASVCKKSGRLSVANLCGGNAYTEYFAQGTVPTESCDASFHQEEIISAATADAQAALDQANTALAQAAELLAATQQALATAQASGDATAVQDATTNYTNAVNYYQNMQAAQQQAQAAYDAALAAAQAQTAVPTDPNAAGNDPNAGTVVTPDPNAGGGQ